MSVEPTSIPNSRDDVQISDLIPPCLKRSSISIRTSFERDPWWTSMGRSPSHSLYLAASHSAVSLVFTKNSVEFPDSMISLARIITARMSGSLWSLSRSLLSFTAGSGLSTAISKSLWVSCFLTTTLLLLPARNPDTESMFPTVADSPIL